MNVVIEENIPLAVELFSQHFAVRELPTRAITHDALQDCDMLIVRSTTDVDERLLKNTPVKIIATPTSGIDHIDINYLQQTQRQFFHAPGCNAVAVSQYIACCISALREMTILQTTQLKAGVVGVGHVGTRVAALLRSLNFEVLENDPPRELRDHQFKSIPLTQLHEVDVLCIHTPLTFDSPFATHQLINAAFLKQLKEGCVVINAGRGAVLDMTQITHMPHLHFCCDVFTQEPNIDTDILNALTLATPHIAGHTIEAKYRGTQMVYDAICNLLKLNATKINAINESTPSWHFDTHDSLEQILLSFYDPRRETKSLQNTTGALAENFLNLRKQHHRHEFSFPKIYADERDVELLKQLGMNAISNN